MLNVGYITRNREIIQRQLQRGATRNQLQCHVMQTHLQSHNQRCSTTVILVMNMLSTVQLYRKQITGH